MSTATLRVNFAGPLVTWQDAGRNGHMRYGVAASGPMDRLSHRAANVALGNLPEASAIEISMGGLTLECTSGMLSFAVTGADHLIDRAGEALGSWVIFSLEPGERLTIRPGKSGSWAYLAIAGDPQVQHWLGHSATHSTSGFGGGALQAGQDIHVRNAEQREDRHGAIPQPHFLQNSTAIRVVLGPQDQHFTDQALAQFQSDPFALTEAYDRMGMRLSGPHLALNEALSIPSEPITRGSVQVAGDGAATILLADHQTTGGYPKIATLISVDVDRVTQMRTKDRLRFTPVSAPLAIQIAREYAEICDAYLTAVSTPKGTLLQRLMRENLISGAVAD